MKLIFLIAAVAASALVTSHAATRPTVQSLAGKWEGEVNFGKFKFSLIMRIATNEPGRIKATLDLPEQGAKDVPINALLFNSPDVRLEIDNFGTAYNGKVNADLTEIEGTFEEGPGGRPETLIFKRSTREDAPEPTRTFTFSEGEKLDVRGYWKGEIEIGPNMKMITGLNVGRLPDGTFRATLDLPEQGARDIPARVSSAGGKTKFEWQGFQAVFNATISEDGKKLAGDWVQMGRTTKLEFARIDGPVQLVPDKLTFDPDPTKSDDVRGYWKGVLETPGGKLRLVLKIGTAPDGQVASLLASIDQGGRELPSSSGKYSESNLTLEWKGIRGKFEAKLSGDGKTLDGKWEQFGAPMPLKLERITAAEANTKS